MSNRVSNGKRDVPRRRASQCGSKGGGSQYDPQVGAAAKQSADNAQAAQQWTQDYYTNTISPLVAAETAQAKQTTEQQNQLFGINFDAAKTAKGMYDNYGVPAQKAYYKMVSDYSAPEEQERQATSAIGDLRTANASGQASLARRNASYGISPNSGNSMALAQDNATAETGAEAGAATRARYNAKLMGMQLTGDAANFSNSGVSNLTQLGGAASGNSGAALGASATALQGANSGAAVPMAGYSLANSAYGNNLDAYSRLASADIQASASADSGLGSFFGSILGVGAKLATGGIA